MACYHPITAYKCTDGAVVFSQLARHDISQTLQLPCGQCVGCKLERSRQWAVRCMHEAAMHKDNSFITLTYDEEHLPHRSQLQHDDFQKFIKRARKKYNLKYYMGGEYGPENGRPHFHACIFGKDWEDKIYFKTTESGEKIYTSATLEKLWPFGYSSTADLTFQSAAYVARYCLQKVTGDMAEEHYKRYDYLGEYQLNPEYSEMSNGIGKGWYEKYKSDVYSYDYLVVNGVKTRPPKYYDKLFDKEEPLLLEDFKQERIARAKERYLDNTDERLNVKEEVAIAKTKQLKRGKI